MIPQEIEYLLDNYEAEDINLKITRADFSLPVPVINLNLVMRDEVSKNWILNVIGHRASQIHFNYIQRYSTIELTDNHPLLWEFSDIQSELYFSGSVTEVDKLIVEINQIDFDLFGIYLNSGTHLKNLLRTTNGLLAKGSKSLLLKYANCLRKYNLTPNIIGERVPTFWDGRNHISAEGLKIFIIHDSFIIAKEFIFEAAL